MSDRTYLIVMMILCTLAGLAFLLAQRALRRRGGDDPFPGFAGVLFLTLAALHSIPWWPGGWA